MKLKKSLFINIDGADGCGKSTSTRILRRMLAKANIPTIYTSEPEFKGSKRSKFIHDILTDGSLDLSKNLQASLFIIARKLHIREVIKPAMKQRKLIITDRYVLSNLAYQGDFTKTKSGVYRDNNCIMKKNIDNIHGFLAYLPDINFYFHMNAKDEIERLIGRPDKEDNFDKYLEHTNNLKALQSNYTHGINESNWYGSPTLSIDAGKNNQFQRALIMFNKIKSMIKLINY